MCSSQVHTTHATFGSYVELGREPMNQEGKVSVWVSLGVWSVHGGVYGAGMRGWSLVCDEGKVNAWVMHQVFGWCQKNRQPLSFSTSSFLLFVFLGLF